MPHLTAITNAESAPLVIKPIIVGLYGVPGCGKTFLINKLKSRAEFDTSKFKFYEGSSVISSIVPGGLDTFKKMPKSEKDFWRERAIDRIRNQCAASGRVGVVAGHFVFWENENDESGECVWTVQDQQTFTHILYLQIEPEIVVQRRQNDSERFRLDVSKEHLQRWQKAEGDQLRLLCLEHGILFLVASPDKVADFLCDFQQHTEESNFLRVQQRLDSIYEQQSKPKSMLVFDGDKTLIAEDTGVLFWKLAATLLQGALDPLKEIFSSLGFLYSYSAFRQVALLYESIAQHDFTDFCEQVAASVQMHPEIVSLLRKATERNIGAVIVTCGLGLIWEKILKQAGVSETVKVIGGGRITGDNVVVTPQVKRDVVSHLKNVHNVYVCAFGDSILDLPMLKEADRAIVVVGEERCRSRSMDAVLLNAIDNEGLLAYQVLLPNNSSPRLNTAKLPLLNITDPQDDFFNFIVKPTEVSNYVAPTHLRVLHATEKNAAKLFMTPMRDEQLSGPALRKAHHEVGCYLAREFLPELLGLEEYPIIHVQGHETAGYQFFHEKKTVIIALMRGGEPMAFGVNEALPLAMFLHAKRPKDIAPEHVEGKETVILVDSVINSGKSVIEFMQRIRELRPVTNIRIAVVAGVIQQKAISSESNLTQMVTADTNFAGIVALRLSDNKFTGKGTTDTGNRLFNTTQL